MSNKILVLKCLEKGYSLDNKNALSILRIEKECDDLFSLNLSTVNLLPPSNSDHYLIIVSSDKKPLVFKLGSNPVFSTTLQSTSLLGDEFMAGIVAVKNSLPTTILFAKTENFFLSLSDFKTITANYCLKLKEKEKIEPEPQKEVTTEKQTQPTYDDEAVATIDYYSLDKEINEKIISIGERDNAFIPIENEISSSQNQTAKEEDDETAFGYETIKSDNSCQEYSPSHPYYEQVKQELDGIFDKFSFDVGLKKYFPTSRFAKVPYSSDKYYVVGEIKENGKIKYICYGVPSKYSSVPPKELEGFCTFIPLSIFDMHGDGFFMMFQDAITGRCKSISN